MALGIRNTSQLQQIHVGTRTTETSSQVRPQRNKGFRTTSAFRLGKKVRGFLKPKHPVQISIIIFSGLKITILRRKTHTILRLTSMRSVWSRWTSPTTQPSARWRGVYAKRTINDHWSIDFWDVLIRLWGIWWHVYRIITGLVSIQLRWYCPILGATKRLEKNAWTAGRS